MSTQKVVSRPSEDCWNFTQNLGQRGQISVQCESTFKNLILFLEVKLPGWHWVTAMTLHLPSDPPGLCCFISCVYGTRGSPTEVAWGFRGCVVLDRRCFLSDLRSIICFRDAERPTLLLSHHVACVGLQFSKEGKGEWLRSPDIPKAPQGERDRADRAPVPLSAHVIRPSGLLLAARSPGW